MRIDQRLTRFHAVAIIVGLLLISTGAAATPPLRPETFDLDNYKGKVVYLDFWASWCGPCQLSFPYMEHLARSLPGKDFVIIADNLDHSRERADAFLRRVGADIPVIYDTKGMLATRFNVSDMPTSILIDKNGKVRYRHEGFFKAKESEYTSHVLELINE